ncbi:MAG: response regulator [Candidatus Rokubacteria bacterium]|nr:response regulator [Candidatus Rokubacteria bacterium]
MRVLIVEDMPAEAETFSDLVAHHGHEPIVAASAEAALESLAASSPDAVLLDIVLPGMSGLEFLRILSERRQRVPVVAMSGVASEADARRSLELGAVEFVPKPVSPDQLGMVLGFLELQVLTRRFTEDVLRLNQRRYPRVEVSLDVKVEQPAAGAARGRSVDLSPFGVKLRSAEALEPGGTVRLSFNPPDGDPLISVLSVLVRKDPDGHSFTFVNLTNPDFIRLKKFVDSRLPQSA